MFTIGVNPKISHLKYIHLREFSNGILWERHRFLESSGRWKEATKNKHYLL